MSDSSIPPSAPGPQPHHSQSNQVALVLTMLAYLGFLGVAVAFGLYRWRSASQMEQDVESFHQQYQQIRVALQHTQRQLADSSLDRGLALCEQGEANRGMLWLERGLRQAQEVHADDLERFARQSLAGWYSAIHPLVRQVSHSGPVRSRSNVNVVSFSQKGDVLLTASGDGSVQLSDAASNPGSHMDEPTGLRNAVLSPDGQHIVLVATAGTAQLWDGRGSITIPLPHQGPVDAVCFSPDSKTLLTGSQDGTAQIWNATTGQPATLPLKHQGPVTAVAFSPDGKSVLTGSNDRSARLWNAATGEPLGAPLSIGHRVEAVAFSEGGTLAVTIARDRTVQRWDTATRKPLGAPWQLEGAAGPMAISPDGRLILTSDDATLQLWDLLTGQAIRPALHAHGTVRCVAFSSDGQTILAGSNDGRAQLWDVVSAQPLGAPMQHPDPVTALALSPDGKTIVTGGNDNTVRWWAATPPTGRTSVMRIPARVYVRAISPDGKTILTINDDQTADLWNTMTGKRLGSLAGFQEPIRAAVFSPDGKIVLTGSGSTVRAWQATDGQPAGPSHSLPTDVLCLTVNTDGRNPASAMAGTTDKKVHGWSVASGEKTAGSPLQLERVPRLLQFAPDLSSAWVASNQHVYRFWNGAGEPPVSLHEAGSNREPRFVQAMAFSPDGKTLLTGSSDQTARLWDTSTGFPRSPKLHHKGFVSSVAFSPDGKVALTGSWDHTARLRDAATGRPIGPSMMHNDIISAVAFHPDGNAFVTAGSNTATVWKLPSVSGTEPQLSAWCETITGLTLDERGHISPLVGQAWQKRFTDAGKWPLPTVAEPPQVVPVDPNFPYRHFEQGALQAAGGNFADAITHFTAAIQGNPGYQAAYAQRALAYFSTGEYDKAMTDCNEALKLAPKSAPALTTRARVYLAQKQYPQAIADAHEAIKLDPASPLALVSRGAGLYHQAEFDKAIADETEALKLEPHLPWACNERGRAYAAKNDLGKAVADFNEAIRIDPDYIWPYTNLALALWQQDDKAGSRKICAAMLERFGKTDKAAIANTVAWTWARVPGAADEFKVPLELAQRAVERQPKNRSFLSTLGAVLYRAGQFTQALERLKQAAAIQGEGGTASDLFLLAVVHQKLGEGDDAEKSLARAIEQLDREQSAKENKLTPTQRQELQLLRKEAEAAVRGGEAK
jgi:WD40 repeat protein/tetratricopeptide (TPR) repeat protein